MLNFEIMKIVLAINDTGSISKAADALFTSQSNISRKLFLLEQELGVELFKRHKGHSKVSLTPAGQHFVQIALKSLSLQSEALNISAYAKRSRLSIAVTNSIASVLLPQFLKSLIEKAKTAGLDMELTVSTNQSYELFDIINSRTADIGVANYASIYDDSSSELVFEEPYVVVQYFTSSMPKTFSVHPSELKVENCIYSSFQIAFDRWHDYWWPAGQSMIRLNVHNSVPELLKIPDSWVIIPLSMAKQLPAEEYRIIALSDPPPARKCYLITHKSLLSYNEKAVRYVCQELRAYFSQMKI